MSALGLVFCPSGPLAVRRSRSALALLSAVCLFFFWLSLPPAFAQAPAPEKLQELTRLLDDPQIRSWIESQKKSEGATPKTKAQTDIFGMWDERARLKFRSVAAGMPKLWSEYAAASGRVSDEARVHGMMPAIVYIALILAASLAVEWALRRFALRLEASHVLDEKIIREFGAAAAGIVVVVGLFFAVDWPPLLRSVLRSYLIAVILFRTVVAVGRVLVASDSVTPAMHLRSLLFFGLLLSTLATVMLGLPLDVDPDAVQALAFVASVFLLVVAIELNWRQDDMKTRMFRTIMLLIIWGLWAAGFNLLCWVGFTVMFLPKILKSIEQVARNYTHAHWPEDPTDGLKAVLVIYGVRTIVLAATLGLLAYFWSTNPQNANVSPSFRNLVEGLLRSLVVILAADFGWKVCHALIEGRLAMVSGEEPLTPADAARRARIRTLLPILRNALAGAVLIVTILTVLAQMGVEIGPLIAGAGIFGVAIGFGSQTLVKDVISGIFYLMDDAFRTGEYIQSGSYMGTVESFSLRSVRLRHHRGPVFTVPFGELGAVQNLSRDWVIDKFRLRVTFDADLAMAKKLTKQVGAELLADEDVGSLIIETVKMKGVEKIDEFGVELGFAFKARPGNQSMIRRRAYAKLRQKFSENGIEFAQPTVQVGNDGKPDAAAAAATTLANKRAAAAKAEDAGAR